MKENYLSMLNFKEFDYINLVYTKYDDVKTILSGLDYIELKNISSDIDLKVYNRDYKISSLINHISSVPRLIVFDIDDIIINKDFYNSRTSIISNTLLNLKRQVKENGFKLLVTSNINTTSSCVLYNEFSVYVINEQLDIKMIRNINDEW